ncbi:HAD-IC family P-type ATPase [Neopusillimonas aromaticivorans]|uniref:HAD-IC family P-type ATPase n=1 Tax=Neopusillimonas aromaticivorans TaxID=2979868 RepID=UPI0025993568|nr:HAD-IC family P-type ATPase [Neopusillimonas aromaticivorans]WJJ94457.1 HAD-IC family P-type ATPase [Neopusillimonas aromaticivorans]
MTKNTPAPVENAHSFSTESVLTQLEAQHTGLSTEESRRRLDRIGPNRLPEPPTDGLLKRFFKHFNDVLIYILLAAATITAVLEHWVDTGVIVGVVVINAIIGFIQEGKAEAALEGIRNMLSPHAQAKRDGQWNEIDAGALVPGDIVRLRSGDRVPADIRLIETNNLRIEESALTGESEPCDKNTLAVAPQAGVGDRTCMAFSGTLVAAGRGLGVVTATGSHTEIGHINRMMSEVQTVQTPLTRQMAEFSKTLSMVIVALAAMMLIIGFAFHDYPWRTCCSQPSVSPLPPFPRACLPS